ncbi:hypothetical protein E1176_12170 [Fulvivirga sp. RKSG066]|uniref:hypothetical protein n=1 Tax=Fulvivirga aurantia TaxID=2529383 RepID=UPI0012BB6E4F|nr:hypothetical protein [Fulvivirga aurantia]MTI21778.1 hypothetical protein [Fulvivirga aurantia]
MKTIAKTLLLFCSLFAINTTYGQSAKTDLQDFINSKVIKKSNEHVIIACNTDQDFLEERTVKLKVEKKRNYPGQLGCCNYVQWQMVANGKFIWTDMDVCDRKYDKSYYTNITTVNIKNNGDELILDLKRDGVSFVSYQILEKTQEPTVNGKDLVDVITLKQIASR